MAAKRGAGVSVGDVVPRLTSTGQQAGFKVELRHGGLNAHRVLADPEFAILENKIEAQLARWDQMWTLKRDAEDKRARVQEGKAAAEQQAQDALAAISACEEILAHTLSVDDRVHWESLKDRRPFSRRSGKAKEIEYDPKSGEPLDVVPLK